jgi:hypothetical protein
VTVELIQEVPRLANETVVAMEVWRGRTRCYLCKEWIEDGDVVLRLHGSYREHTACAYEGYSDLRSIRGGWFVFEIPVVNKPPGAGWRNVRTFVQRYEAMRELDAVRLWQGNALLAALVVRGSKRYGPGDVYVKPVSPQRIDRLAEFVVRDEALRLLEEGQ